MADFKSGAKSTELKPRYDLIERRALLREAKRMAEGVAAHGERNYRQGVGDDAFKTDRLNHLMDHLLNYMEGDRSDDHLAAIRCGASILIYLEEHE